MEDKHKIDLKKDVTSNMTNALFTRDTHKTFHRFVKGEHIYLYDETGKAYIDGTSGTVIANIGHGRVEIAQAMARQAEKVAFVSPVIAITEPAEKLAEELISLTPPAFTRCWYQTTGSEAIEAAIKLARVAHVEAGRESKYLIISRWQSYHGSTIGSLSATGHAPRRSPFQSLLLPFPHIPEANCYRCPFQKTPDTCELKCATALENEIRHVGASVVSGFITEPIVGSGGGVTIPPDGYFEIIREICDKYKIFWIVDEIMTGFWRTGPTFAFQHWTPVPDMIAFAKGVTAGYAPLSGLIVQEKLYELIHGGGGSFKSAGTLAGNPVSCAAGLKTLELVKQENIPNRVPEVGDDFLSHLNGLRKFRIVGDVRGRGLISAVEFVKDKETKSPFPGSLGVYKRVVNAALNRNLLIYGTGGTIDGVEGDIVMVAPPLTISKVEIDDIVSRLADAIAMVESELMD